MDRLRNAIGWTVLIAWGTSFVLDAALKNYDPPVSVHALMMIVAGAAFGGSIIKRNGANGA